MRKATIHRLGTLEYAGTESLNTICSNLSFAGRNLKKIIFTSCTASEGKSFMTMQIMQNLAYRGKRVVLVDTDLRRSVLTSRYEITTEGEFTGLAHYLAGYCKMEDILYETNIPNAYFIPIGRDVANPVPMLDAPEFSQLLDALAQQFDMVIVDAPPVGLVIDAAEVAKYCDGVVFVIKYNATRRRELLVAKRQMEQAGCPVLGCIINQVTLDTISAKKNYSRAYYSHYGNDYYRKEDGTKVKKSAENKGSK